MRDGIRLSIGALAIAVVLLAQLLTGAFFAGKVVSDIGNLDDRATRIEAKLDQLIRPAITEAQK